MLNLMEESKAVKYEIDQNKTITIESDNSKPTVSPFVRQIITTIIIFMILFLVFVPLEKILFATILLVVRFSVLAYIISFGLHYILIRYAVMSIVFPGQHWLFRRMASVELQKNLCRALKYQINSTIQQLKEIESSQIPKVSSMQSYSIKEIRRNIRQTYSSISSYIRENNEVQRLNKLSKFQLNMSTQLTNLKNAIKTTKIYEILEQAESIFKAHGKFEEFRGNDLDESISAIKIELNKVIELLSVCLMEKGIFRNFLTFCYNNTFGDIKQLKVEILSRLNCEEHKLEVDKNVTLDLLLINSIIAEGNDENEGSSDRNKNKEYDSNSKIKEISESQIPSSNLMIVCLPNASCLEVFCYSDNKWVEFYLKNKISLLLWSYRGYGNSSGTTTISNIKTDIEKVINYAKNLERFSKIGIHGISIGCIPTCHAAGLNLIDICFIDRGFSNLNSVVKFTYGPVCYYLFQCLFVDEVKNVLNFIKSSTPKIISCDPEDDIITNEASLKNGIAQGIIGYLKSKEVISKESKYFFENVFGVQTDVFICVLKRIFEKILSSQQHEMLLNESHSNSTTIINITSSAADISARPTSLFKKSNFEAKLNSSVISSKSQEYNYGTEDKSDRERNPEDGNDELFLPERETMNKVKSIFLKFDAGGDSFWKLHKHSKDPLKLKEKLDVFFTNLLVWGSYRIGKIVATDKKVIFRALLKKISNMTEKIRQISSSESYKISDDVREDFKKFVDFFERLETYFSKLIFKGFSKQSQSTNDKCEESKLDEKSDTDSRNSFSYRNAEISDFIKNNNIGNLLPLSCGHNGFYSEEEKELLTYYLINSKFI